MLKTHAIGLNSREEATGEVACFHCGDPCPSDAIAIGEKRFCCHGCKTVYELLHEKDLCRYYSVDGTNHGVKPPDAVSRRFEFLDDPVVIDQLCDFADGRRRVVTFRVPGMYCSSCIWLLEKLNKLHAGVLSSRVDFLRKELRIVFNPDSISLRDLAVLLASIGYEPSINLESVAKRRNRFTDKKLYYKVGVAGFAFGNVMLLSFPHYLAGEGGLDPSFRKFFGYICLALSLPVLVYCASDYFKSAWTGLKQRFLNIDVPIALGIIVLFGRSAYDIVSGSGAGFLDSFTGLVFFLLIGQVFQKKSFDALTFDRDYRSFFPLSVTVRNGSSEKSIPLTRLKVGDRIIVRNHEIVPADAVVIRGEAGIDYSFVTGESDVVPQKSGDVIYAGGRQVGQAIELEVVRTTEQSHLAKLWQNDVFNSSGQSRLTRAVDSVSKYFTAAVLAVAAVSGAYWYVHDPSLAPLVVTAVLIVACPCALALSTPFTFGSALRWFGKTHVYLKNTDVVESLANVDTIVFDKTGTLTQTGSSRIHYHGDELCSREKSMIASVLYHSTHPLSRRILKELDGVERLPVSGFEEVPGKGVSGVVGGVEVKAGSASWVGFPEDKETRALPSAVYVTIGNAKNGRFSIIGKYRQGVEELVQSLRKQYRLLVLSGDHEYDRSYLEKLFGDDTKMLFRQTPENKLALVQGLKDEGRRVLMIGDGLNDAGALKAADVGISVAEDVNTFAPACDGIVDAEHFPRLDRYMTFARASYIVVMVSFGISFLYNLAGLSFAVAGMLSPLVSAILMPVSSVTIVAFALLATSIAAKRVGLVER